MPQWYHVFTTIRRAEPFADAELDHLSGLGGVATVSAGRTQVRVAVNVEADDVLGAVSEAFDTLRRSTAGTFVGVDVYDEALMDDALAD